MKGLLMRQPVPSVDLSSRKGVALTSQQIALILALESILQQAGLWLVCARCAKERGTYSHLVTQNDPQDETWTIDCPCTNRRFPRATLAHTMRPSGDLFMLLPDLTRATGLTVRCPVKKTGCLTTPLTIRPESEGMLLRCQCWTLALGAGTYRFRKQVAVPA